MNRPEYIRWRPIARPLPDGRGERLLSAISARWPKEFSKEKPLCICEGNILYFRGLADAGLSGAKELVRLYKLHGQIDIWKEPEGL